MTAPNVFASATCVTERPTAGTVRMRRTVMSDAEKVDFYDLCLTLFCSSNSLLSFLIILVPGIITLLCDGYNDHSFSKCCLNVRHP